MTIQVARQSIHWNYFLAIEDDVLQLSRYIEFSNKNMDVYSLELARLLFAAASEVDVISKELIGIINHRAPAENINHYREAILPVISHLPRQTVEMPRYGLQLVPWQNWARPKSPDWWRACNVVKHDRANEFEAASLRNVLNAVAALLLLISHLYKYKGEKFLCPAPRLCVPDLSVASIDTMPNGQVLWLDPGN